ncbi:Undecaprenyl-phosphate mannosyltransferase [compost metagenome]
MESRQASINRISGCVIIPTYNNERTLERVIRGVLELVPAEDVIIVNDGSTDSTAEILKQFESQVTVLVNKPNRGKGYSLRKAFKFAQEKGYENALTIDSDGQHYPSDIPLLVEQAILNPGAVIMGSRNMEQEGVPQKSSFGNKFSNFWFKVETWITLPDTQTGFRIYPLKPMKKIWLFTNKFELEIEVIVKLAWRFVPFVAVPIQVKYDPNERVSHFRPARDFTRISILNTFLVLTALIWYYPRKFFSIQTWNVIKHEAIKPEESNFKKALSIGFGVFMGIVPIWGFQLLIGIPLAVLFRMNKVLFIAAANISIPPMIPFIIYGSFLSGQLFLRGETNISQLTDLSLEAIKANAYHYVIGACVFAVIAFVVSFLVSFGLLKLFRKEPKINI